ncbi:hypothetical protein PMAYCL1PPCAC_32521 [Pristionchus mayeri]|uniref:Transmembrane protein n=1 Tax=Pristionchus mayeri TaxID=1317129 RepID=A0AAN5IG66_9BILA|nr:hypothetical protein PMAYCL1PPCAC_32521 [Pristionchus mayeri]
MVSSLGEIRRLFESPPLLLPNGDVIGFPGAFAHSLVMPALNDLLFHPVTVVLALVLGVSLLVVLSVMICVKVCLLSALEDDDEEWFVVSLFVESVKRSP